MCRRKQVLTIQTSRYQPLQLVYTFARRSDSVVHDAFGGRLLARPQPPPQLNLVRMVVHGVEYTLGRVCGWPLRRIPPLHHVDQGDDQVETMVLLQCRQVSVRADRAVIVIQRVRTYGDKLFVVQIPQREDVSPVRIVGDLRRELRDFFVATGASENHGLLAFPELFRQAEVDEVVANGAARARQWLQFVDSIGRVVDPNWMVSFGV